MLREGSIVDYRLRRRVRRGTLRAEIAKTGQGEHSCSFLAMASIQSFARQRT